MTAPRRPICAADLDRPCRCAEVFAAHEERLAHWKRVEAHQGRMMNAETSAIRADMVRDLMNHNVGDCYR